MRKRAWNSHFSGGLGQCLVGVAVGLLLFLIWLLIQENEPGTATFMEDSARDGGTVTLAAVIMI